MGAGDTPASAFAPDVRSRHREPADLVPGWLARPVSVQPARPRACGGWRPRRQVPSRLPSDPGTETLPIWSPDGSRVLYPSSRNGPFDLYSKAATGAGQEELLVRMGTPTGWGTDWSRDGRFILYQIPGAKTGQDLWIAPQFGDRKSYPYLQTQFNEQSGMFSPDGRSWWWPIKERSRFRWS